MPTVRPSGAGDEAVGDAEIIDGGAILNAGNTGSDSPSSAIPLAQSADDQGNDGSKVVAKDGTGASTTDRAGIAKAFAKGTFAYNATPDDVVVRGGGQTTDVAGHPFFNRGFATPGANYNGRKRDGIHASSGMQFLGNGATLDIYARPSTEITPAADDGDLAGTTQLFVAPSGDGEATSIDLANAYTKVTYAGKTVPFSQFIGSGEPIPSGKVPSGIAIPDPPYEPPASGTTTTTTPAPSGTTTTPAPSGTTTPPPSGG